MTDEEKKEALQGLEARRDELQKSMSEARQQRVELQLKDIDEYRSFLQKIGELSFLLGAAIIPLIIVSDKKDEIDHLAFVFSGTTLYLIGGLLAFWRSKNIFEKNADDSPQIGLDLEINTYPLIYAHNKLLIDLDNKNYIEEFRSTSTQLLEWAPKAIEKTKPKVSLWLDALLINFVLASLLIVRPIWPYSISLYWIIFAVVSIIIVLVTASGYMRSWKSQIILQSKREELAKIKAEYQKWHNDTILNPKR